MHIKVAVIFSFIIFPLQVYAKNTIFWQTYHRPPGIIMIGDDKGTGFVEKALDLIIEKLPDYKHEKPMTTLARALSDMKAGQSVCHPALFRTKQREKFMHFSQSAMINPTNRIVAHPGKVEVLAKKDGSVNLIELLQLPDLTFALVKGRSYTQVIDDVLADYLDQTHLFKMTNTDLSSLFQMIAMGRIDVSIAYPFEVNYYLNDNPKERKGIKTYAISGVDKFAFGAVACPKTKWGKKVINQVNMALDELKPTEAYHKAVTTWWEDEADSEAFRQLYVNEFLNQ